MSEQLIEDKKDRPVPKPEALDERYIAQKRYDESFKWVNENYRRLYQLLMNSRSFWQQLVDWAHQHPVLYGAIVVPASLLIMGGLLAAFFFAGAPLLGVVIGAGVAILSVGLVSVGVYLDKTTEEPIEDFFGKLCDQYSPTISNQQKQNQLNNAINAMKPSMRATANAIVAAQKNEFDNKEYKAPSGIQAKEKLRQLFQKDVPANFPLSVNDFIDSQDACCKTSGKEENQLYFKSTYPIYGKTQGTISVLEKNSENKVNFFIDFMQKVFEIQLECKADLKTFTHTVGDYNYYYCDITGKKVEAILNADIEEVKAKAKQFYKEWQEEKIKDAGLLSAKEELISTLEQGWASGNKTREKIITDINKELKVTSSSEEFLTGKCELFEPFIYNDGDNVVEQKVVSRKQEFEALKTYLNNQFGKNSYTFTDTSQEVSNSEYREEITITFKIPVADAEKTENKVEQKSPESPQHRAS